MIEIHLHLEIGRAHFSTDGMTFGLVVDEIAGHVAGIDRLDHQHQAMFGQLFRCQFEVGDIDRTVFGPISAFREHAGHGVDRRRPHRQRVFNGLVDPGGKFRLTPRQRSDTALTSGPVTGWHVKEGILEIVLFQPSGDIGRRIIVGEEEFNRRETGLGRRSKTLRKRHFVEHHREVGSKLRHGAPFRNQV